MPRSVYTYVSPNGRYAVAFAGTPTVVDLQEKRIVTKIEGLARSHAVFSEDGRLLMGIDARGEAVVWDSRAGAEKLRFAAEGSTITAYAFSPDGQWIAVADVKGRLRIADARTGRVTRTVQIPGADEEGERAVYHMGFDRRGQRLTLAGVGGRLVTFSNAGR